LITHAPIQEWSITAVLRNDVDVGCGIVTFKVNRVGRRLDHVPRRWK